MEVRDLYDANKNLTGKTILKGEPIPKGNYIIVVLVVIQNSKGELLIQKRSQRKGGTFGSTAGHAKTGETGIQAALTEVREELGIELKPQDLKKYYEDRDDDGQYFFELYYLKRDIDINTLTLQEEEVEYVEWMTLEKIDKLREQGVFKVNHRTALDSVLKRVKDEG